MQTSRIGVQVKKEWREFLRDKLSLSLAFILPLFALLIFGWGIRLEAKNVPLVVRDLDNTSISREYVERLYATNLFRPVPNKYNNLQENIDRNLAKAAVTVPEGFARHVLRQEKAPVQIEIDGTDIANAQIIFNSLKAANSYFGAILQTVREPDQSPRIVAPQTRIWFNPGREESLFIVPGSFGVIFWMFPGLLAAVAASREKEQGTLARVYAANMSAFEYMAGKAIVYTAVGTAMTILVLVASMLVFGVYPRGGLLQLFIGVGVGFPLYILTSVIFGLCMGTFASTQTTAVQATSTLGFFPCLLLSGFVYPISNIAFPLSLFSLVVPARYFIELTRDTFVKGVNATLYVPFVLALFCLFMSALMYMRTRRMQYED